VLMERHRVSLQELCKAADELERRGYEHWADLRLYVVKRKVYFQPPGSEDVESVETGQLAMLPVIDVISDVEERIKKLRERSTGEYGQICKQRHVMRNAPVVAGTRIPTAAIKRFADAGFSVEQIIREYPVLTPEDVESALAYEERRLARSA
jgi:uncharacterized protein (DUF433 family)